MFLIRQPSPPSSAATTVLLGVKAEPITGADEMEAADKSLVRFEDGVVIGQSFY